jgi:hypothetical protein
MLKKEAKRKQWGLSAVQSAQRTCLNYYLWVDGVFRWAKAPEAPEKEEVVEEVEEVEEKEKEVVTKWTKKK